MYLNTSIVESHYFTGTSLLDPVGRDKVRVQRVSAGARVTSVSLGPNLRGDNGKVCQFVSESLRYGVGLGHRSFTV